MKLLKSKTFLGISCIVIAAVIAFFVLPALYSSQSKTVSVVRVNENVSAGTVLKESMLIISEVGSYGLSDNIIVSKDKAIGMVASENLYKGEILSKQRLISEKKYLAKVEEDSKGLSKGQCLVALQFPSASSGIAGIIRSGNIVDVYECVEAGEGKANASKSLSSMYVYDVLNSELKSLDELDEMKENLLAEEAADLDLTPAYVVFRCTAEQAQTLMRLEKAESLHLTLQNIGG